MKPVEMIALGVAIGVGGAGVLWGLAQAIPAIGVAFGLAIAIATTGVVAAGPVAGWIVPTAAAGVGAAGVATAYVIVVKVMESSSKETFSWTLPVLAILAGFLVEICKEFYPEAPLTKILFATVAVFLILIGGVLYKKSGLVWKLLGISFHLVPPSIILMSIVGSSAKPTFSTALADVSILTWASVVGLLIVAFAIGFLSRRGKPQTSGA